MKKKQIFKNFLLQLSCFLHFTKSAVFFFLFHSQRIKTDVRQSPENTKHRNGNTFSTFTPSNTFDQHRLSEWRLRAEAVDRFPSRLLAAHEWQSVVGEAFAFPVVGLHLHVLCLHCPSELCEYEALHKYAGILSHLIATPSSAAAATVIIFTVARENPKHFEENGNNLMLCNKDRNKNECAFFVCFFLLIYL